MMPGEVRGEILTTALRGRLGLASTMATAGITAGTIALVAHHTLTMIPTWTSTIRTTRTVTTPTCRLDVLTTMAEAHGTVRIV